MARTSKKTEGHEYKISKDVKLVCYDFGDSQKASIIINEAFKIMGRIVEGNKKGTYFFSGPSYQDKNGEWHNLAYCFDKDLIADINESLAQFMNEDR